MPLLIRFPVVTLVLLAGWRSAALSATVPPGAVYQESGGIVVMEAERTPSPTGTGSNRWEVYEPGELNFVFGATGNAHLEFQGNSSNGGSPTTPLTYTFRIHQAGYYHLHLRARARLDGAPDDKNNDCYVKVAGLDGATFAAGPNAGGDHLDDAPLSLLNQDTKMYGGAPNTWGWANQMDAGGSSNKRWPVYRFNAGSTYRLTVSGRSIKFNLDRIVFRKSTIVDTSAKSASIPESALAVEGGAAAAVRRIMLVDADSDIDLGELTDGGLINLATAGSNLNLRVDTSPPVIGSVRFSLDGDPDPRTDLALPYTIGGDNIGDDYLPWTPSTGDHRLTVTPREDGGNLGTPVTVNFSVTRQLPAGSPVANAGSDRTVVLPTGPVVLAGAGSDPGGAITSYQWHQIAGPSVATFTGRATATATAGDLVQGSYRFRLSVTDDAGLSGFDELTVTLVAAPGSPVVNAGVDRTVTLPATAVTLAGAATDPANSIYFYLWSQISGPGLATRSGETTLDLTASRLLEGTYVFRLRAFSNSGLTGADEVMVKVAEAGVIDGISGFAPPTLQRIVGNGIRLVFQGAPGLAYSFQRSVNLGSWTTLETRDAGMDGAIEFTDSSPPAGNAFYRLGTP